MFFAGDAQLCGQLTKVVLVKIKALLSGSTFISLGFKLFNKETSQ
jgi:hypothetical protein